MTGTLVQAFVLFLAGGACGALLVAPRLGWHRLAAGPAQLPCRRRHLEDSPDMLQVDARAAAGSSADALRADAVDAARLVYGPDARLSVEAVSDIHVLPSGRLAGTVTVRCLSGQEAC